MGECDIHTFFQSVHLATRADKGKEREDHGESSQQGAANPRDQTESQQS